MLKHPSGCFFYLIYEVVIYVKLNERQKRFADEYIICGNSEQAAIRAGYSKSYARGNAHKLLAHVSIKEYIEERNKAIESKKIATMQEVKEFWTNVLSNVDIELKERLKASEYLAKSSGGFIDKVQHSGHITSDVEIIITGDDSDVET